MRVLVVVIALVAACAADVDPNDAQQMQDLLNWLKTEDRDEEGLLENTSDEQNKIYMANLKKSVISVNDHNNNDGADYLQGYNEFSYMDDDQKLEHLGLNISGLIMAKREFLEMERLTKRDVLDFVARQDDTVDYTAKLPAIKNQGSCGSCWTFGAAAAFEYQLNRKSAANPKAISEEQLLDCTYPSRDGCNGGWPTDCYTWMKNAGTGGKKANYVASMADYPYQGSDGACKITSKNQMSGFEISGSKYLANEDAVIAAVGNSEIGVLSVAIAVINSFYSFKSGVYYDASCASAGINHAVDIVGYGKLDGVNYYKVRNSWGSSWGDKGYIRMRRGDNLCSIAKYAHYPMVTGESDGSDDGDDDSDDGGDDEDDGSDNEECIKANTGLFPDEQKLSQREYQSVSACQSWCDEKTGCVAVAISPSYWAYRECFLVSAGDDLGARTGWSGGVKSCWNKDEDEDEDEDEDDDGSDGKTCTWKEIADTKFKGGIGKPILSMTEACAKCLETEGCAGVSCKNKNKCQMNKKAKGKDNAKFTAYKLICTKS